MRLILAAASSIETQDRPDDGADTNCSTKLVSRSTFASNAASVPLMSAAGRVVLVGIDSRPLRRNTIKHAAQPITQFNFKTFDLVLAHVFARALNQLGGKVTRPSFDDFAEQLAGDRLVDILTVV